MPFILIMAKSKKRCSKKCLKHTFQLKPVHIYAVFCRSLQVSFCSQSGSASSNIPQFNNDKLHFTTSFYLPVHAVIKGQYQKQLSKDLELYRNKHEKNKMEHMHEKKKMLVAKPQPQYSYCSVCKRDFDDYLDHIKSEQHKKKLKNNKFSSYIDQFCQQTKRILEKSSQLQKKQSKIDIQSQKGQLFWAESNNLDQILWLKKEANAANRSECRQSNEGLASNRSFQTYSKVFEQKNMPNFQRELAVKNPHSFPMKKNSEITQGKQFKGKSKPIIKYRNHRPN